jgi:DNA-directed RNA polymerase subunit beta'
MTLGLFEDGDDSQDVVLDDRTARAYSLEGGLGDGFSFEAAPFISDDEDDLIIDDDVSALEDDDFEDEDEDEDEDEE